MDYCCALACRSSGDSVSCAKFCEFCGHSVIFRCTICISSLMAAFILSGLENISLLKSTESTKLSELKMHWARRWIFFKKYT